MMKKMILKVVIVDEGYDDGGGDKDNADEKW